MSYWRRITGVILASAIVGACSSATPSPTTAPAAATQGAAAPATQGAASTPTQVIAAAAASVQTIGLQRADAPAALQLCPQSGDVSKSTDSDTIAEWGYEQKQGATSGYQQVFAESPSSCKSFQTLPTGGPSAQTSKLIGSVVVQYKDEAAARAAAGGGVFGVNPSHDILAKPGAVQGSATGLGDTSFYVYQAGTGALGLALWQRKTYVVALVAIGLAESDVKKAASTINGRIP